MDQVTIPTSGVEPKFHNHCNIDSRT